MTTQTWDAIKTEGNDFFKAGNYQQAIASYTKSIDAFNTEASNWNAKGGSSGSMATAPTPRNEAMLFSNRSAAHLKANEFESAQRDALRAIAADPLFAKAYPRLHTARCSLGLFREAAEGMDKGIEELRQAMNSCPASGKSEYQQSITELTLLSREARENMVLMAKARSLCQEAYSIINAPATFDASVNGSGAAENTEGASSSSPSSPNQQQGAEERQKRAMQLLTTAEVSLRELFQQYKQTSGAIVAVYAEARAPSDPDAMNTAIQRFYTNTSFSNDPYFCYVRALVNFYRQGEAGFKTCQLLLRESLISDPDNKASKMLRKKIQLMEATKEEGNTAFKSKSYQVAIDAYTRAIEIDPLNKKYSSMVRGNRAAALMELTSVANANDRALVDCEFAIENGNDSAKMFARKARVCEKLEKWDDALRAIKQADERSGSGEYRSEVSGVQQRSRNAQRKDWYKVLGLDKSRASSYTDVEIKKAYKRSALVWHPDKWAHSTEEEISVAELKFKEVQEANAILTDPRKKRMYDNGQLDNDTEGASAGGGGGMGGMGGGMHGADMSDIFGMMFGGGMGGMPQRGGSARGNRAGTSGRNTGMPPGFSFSFQ